MTSINKLSLVRKSTEGKQTNARDTHEYTDFYIDGKSFEDYLPQRYRGEFITHIGWNLEKSDDTNTIAILSNVQKSSLHEGRILLYGCPIDQDPMCGAITAELVEQGNEIIWRNYMFENQYSAPSMDGLEVVPEFHFSKPEYTSVFQVYLNHQ